MQRLEQSGVTHDRKSLDMVRGSMRMLGDRLLVKPLDLKLSNTLIADWKGRAVRGEVVAVGPGEYSNIYNKDRSQVRKAKAFTPTTVKVGDIVQLGGMENGGYAFPRIQLNGVEHLVCSEKDVTGIELTERERSLEAGAAKCPVCSTGWLQYLIKNDTFSCSRCYYSIGASNAQQQFSQ